MVLAFMRGAARLLRSVPRRLRGRESVFTRIYATNEWGNPESVSGDGSSLRETRIVRQVLPILVGRYDVQTLLDVPCGDCHWMREIDFCGRAYIGADIVAELVARNQTTFGSPKRSFVHCDLVRDPLPPADLVLVRDCMIHLSNADVLAALRNVRRSGARYLLATTYTARPTNPDIVTGDWHPINLQAPPFALPRPLELISEEWDWADGYHADKCLGLWESSVLPI
jgi:methyltransferase family protein